MPYEENNTPKEAVKDCEDNFSGLSEKVAEIIHDASRQQQQDMTSQSSSSDSLSNEDHDEDDDLLADVDA